MRAHLPVAVGAAVSILVAVGLLAAAAWTRRDIPTLTLTLAAALAASPIVWMHYFLLLLVPIALTRPRLSLLWFVPLAYYPLGESAWPAGDTKKLAVALVTTVVLIGASLVLSLREGSALRPAAQPRLGPFDRVRLDPAELPEAPQPH